MRAFYNHRHYRDIWNQFLHLGLKRARQSWSGHLAAKPEEPDRVVAGTQETARNKREQGDIEEPSALIGECFVLKVGVYGGPIPPLNRCAVNTCANMGPLCAPRNKGEARVNGLRCLYWHLPNQIRREHFHSHGSARLEHVAGDFRHLCPCLLLKDWLK